MANGIRQVVVGIVLAGAVGGAIALIPTNKPHEDVAFLERVASTVERAAVVAPDAREYLARLAGRHRSPLGDAQLDLRRQRALERITHAAQTRDPAQRPVRTSRSIAE